MTTKSSFVAGPEKISGRNEEKWYKPCIVPGLTKDERLVLGYYEAQCAENIKRRIPIEFSNGLVRALGGPLAGNDTIAELTKWVKITLSRKKHCCNFCGLRTLPQRCVQECSFFGRSEGCLAGELCHDRHVINAPGENLAEKNRPLFLHQKLKLPAEDRPLKHNASE